MKEHSVWLLGLVLLSACAGGPAPPQETRLSNAVHWVSNAAEYRAIAEQTYRLAGRRLRELVADKERGAWAVALDCDETVLDNSPYQRELEWSGEKYSEATWLEWCRRQEAEPVPGAVAFLTSVRALGGRIAIVTNRDSVVREETRANFRGKGVPFDVILTRGEHREKELRWQQVAAGKTDAGLPPLEIVLWIGDNIADFPELDQSVWESGAEALEGFGDRWFVLPNPMYGSWQR